MGRALARHCKICSTCCKGALLEGAAATAVAVAIAGAGSGAATVAAAAASTWAGAPNSW